MSTHNLCFKQKWKNISFFGVFFFFENFQLLEVKFSSIYLNRRVFVMFFVHVPVISYVEIILTLFIPRLFIFKCIGKAVLRDCVCVVFFCFVLCLYLQISPTASSPTFTDRKRFPNFFRLESPDHKLNPAKIAMMREFNWKKVATINHAQKFFSMVRPSV